MKNGWHRFFEPASEGLYWALFLFALGFVVFTTSFGLFHSLWDATPFRQTQTALSVRYLLEGGAWFAYETPVLGPPWSIPYEFPFYQWCVALTVKVTSLGIEEVGRLVSRGFFLLMGIPGFFLFRFLGATRGLALAGVALAWLSPFYLYWSRSVMIESTALCLALGYFVACLHANRRWVFWLALVLGVLAGMTKVTTFAGLWGAFGVVAVLGVWRERTWASVRMSGVLLGVPVLAVYAWTRFSDHQKHLNPLAWGAIDSKSMHAWNFGTWDQVFDRSIWTESLPGWIGDAFGYFWIFVVVAVLSYWIVPRLRAWFFGLCALHLLVFVTFTNLYVKHSYYSYANRIYFTLALIVFCIGLQKQSRAVLRALGLVLLFGIAGWQVQRYWNVERLALLKDSRPPSERIFRVIEVVSNPDEVVAIYSGDWSSEWPWFANRRVLSDRGDLGPEHAKIKQSLALIAAEGRRVSVYVNCRGLSEKTYQNAKGFALSVKPIESNLGGCQVFGLEDRRARLETL